MGGRVDTNRVVHLCRTSVLGTRHDFICLYICTVRSPPIVLIALDF